MSDVETFWKTRQELEAELAALRASADALRELQRISESSYVYAERGGGRHVSTRPWHVCIGSGPPASRAEGVGDDLLDAIRAALQKAKHTPHTSSGVHKGKARE